MLKLILAVSADGYLARGPDDDMRWTGPTDKAVFRMLTSVGGECGVGHASWQLMPRTLAGRVLIPITQDGRLVVHRTDWNGTHTVPSETIGRFAHRSPNGWLLGGPRLAMEALAIDLVDQVFLCRSKALLFDGIDDVVTPWLASRGETQNAGTPWRRGQRIQMADELTVDVWSKVNGRRPQP